MSISAPVFHDPSEKAMDYQQTLDYTQSLRKQLIQAQLASTGGALPTDKDGVELLLKIAKDIDHTSHSDKRNKIDQSNSETGREVADAMRIYVGELQNNNPFARSADGSAVPNENVRDAEFTVVDENIPTIDLKRLGTHEFVDGEEELGVIMETADEFVARMAPIMAAKREAEGDE